jgi:hypothetical protein
MAALHLPFSAGWRLAVQIRASAIAGLRLSKPTYASASFVALLRSDSKLKYSLS